MKVVSQLVVSKTSGNSNCTKNPKKRLFGFSSTVASIKTFQNTLIAEKTRIRGRFGFSYNPVDGIKGNLPNKDPFDGIKKFQKQNRLSCLVRTKTLKTLVAKSSGPVTGCRL